MLAELITMLIVSHHVLCDPFECDSDLGLGPLGSYLYTCDSVTQCVDRSDEAGCLECHSGRLLLTGLEPTSQYFQYETIFELQSYKLENKAVYRTTSSSLLSLYLRYSASNTRWEVVPHVDKDPIFSSSETRLAEPYVVGVVWEGGVKVECVVGEVDKCYGALEVVTLHAGVIKLSLDEKKELNNRVVYSNDEHELRYVLSSTKWEMPHWQLLDLTTEKELIAFPGSTTQHPEYITTPGVYQESGTWTRSSNVYVTCAGLEGSQEARVNCNFKKGVCPNWELKGGSLLVGAPEPNTLFTRLPSSSYLTADKHSSEMIYQLSSQKVSLEEDGCLVVRYANTVTGQDSHVISVNWKTLASSGTPMETSDCTNKNVDDCSRITDIGTMMMDVAKNEGLWIEILITMGVHEQIGGVVALFEVLLVPDETCYDGILGYVDPCMDLDYPCDDNECTPKGLLSYQCVCSDPATSYGPHCDTVTEKRCTTPPTLEHGGDMTVIEGYKGRNMVLMDCEEGYLLQGDYPRCTMDGTYTTSPTCQPTTPCPTPTLPHSLPVINGSSISITCDTGYHPLAPQTLNCADGQWDKEPELCLLECLAPLKDVPKVANDVTGEGDDVTGEGDDVTSEGDDVTGEGDDVTSNVTVETLVCRYSADSAEQNFTNCITESFTINVPERISLSTDISISVAQSGQLCVSFSNSTRSEDHDDLLECLSKCEASSYINIIRHVDGIEQSISVTTNYDFISSRVVNSAGNLSYQVSIYMALVLLLVLSRG